MDKNIKVSGIGLEMWFTAKIKKYQNSKTAEHLQVVWEILTGNTTQDDSLKSFFEKELTSH